MCANNKIETVWLNNIVSFLAVALLLLTGCTEKRIPNTLPPSHPNSWMISASPDFHGKVVSNNGFASCLKCHNLDSAGGRSGIACNECHGPNGTACIGCHGGTDNTTGAPPTGLDGETSDTTLAVGAHTAHLTASALAAAMQCSTCHLVPSQFLDTAHFDLDRPSGEQLDSIAEITWQSIADPGNAVWDRTNRICTNTYCHGNFSGGNASNTPNWTGSDQAVCGSCHDVGSDAALLQWKHDYHVNQAGLACVECHASVTNDQLEITDSSLHVNGVVDTLTRDPNVCGTCHGPGGLSCTSCHGGTDNQTGAPPKGLEGETATTSLAVGAHTTHLEDGALTEAFECNECHLIPVDVSDPGHLGADSIAELTWGTLSGPGSSWNRIAATCTNTYCHGNFSGGNVSNSPIWTGSDQAVCGSCHDVGSNAASLQWEHDDHVNQAGLACVECHASVTNDQLDIIDLSLHVNGIVDTLTRDPNVCVACHGPGGFSCTNCHGGAGNHTGAPPTGLRGETATTSLAVGAHTEHLAGGTISEGFSCSECHIKPAGVFDPGHLGADSIAELTWSALAGAGSSWDRSTATCTNTYCHGNFNGGNASNAPIWTASNQAVCGSCHDVGSNPSQLQWEHQYHIESAGLACVECHSSVTNDQLDIINMSLHINGAVDTLTRDPDVCATCHGPAPGSCITCHGGTDNLTGAPPAGLEGEMVTFQLAVGAHTSHMEGGSMSDAFACDDCHQVPTTLSSPGHLGADSIAELTWSTLAGTGSSWNRTAATCSNTYCHGNFGGGNTSNTPIWTSTNQATCGSCHDVGSNPSSLSGEHERHIIDKNLDCVECHVSVVDQLENIVDQTLHVNGQKNVSFQNGGNYQSGSCSGLNGQTCHGRENW